MATAVGAGFNIDALLNSITKADKALSNLMSNNEEASKSVINAFQKMSSQGVVPYTQELEKQLNLYKRVDAAITTTFGTAKTGFEGMKSDIVSATDSLNKMIETLKRTDEFKQNANFTRQAQEMRDRAMSRSLGTDWSISAEDVLGTSEQRAANAKAWRDSMVKMYREMFDFIEKQEKDFREYEQKQFDESLSQYKQQKREKEKSETDAHNNRKKQIEEAFINESKADQEAYEMWLRTKHREAEEHKRIENEKFEATKAAIRRQNEEYEAAEQKRKQIQEQNATAKYNSEAAQYNREQQTRMYEQMFDEIDKKEQAYREQRHKNNEQQKKDKLKQLSDEIDAYQEYLERVRQLQEESAKRDSESRRRNYDSIMRVGDTSDNAINYYNRLYSNKGVMSINNMNTALQKLRDAQNKLNLSTDDGKRKYKELGEAISQIEEDLNKYKETAKEVVDEHNELANSGGRLQSALAAAFSISAITGYVNKVVEVRGEFELQHKAIQTLVQDVDAANTLWEKTINLAVKSPFRVKELVTYTKQLAAYRIETSQLYDKTKMLADISAGLGVDMNRLILAYGQVKAANYLRGTELRQFSEAGINILKELSEYFEAIEGRAVSVGEVFERVSRRMVSFADVDAVLQKVTGESGIFYQMQEKQAETMQGLIMNLRDSYDLMLDDIGKNNEDTIRSVIGFVKNLTDNWQIVAKSMGVAIGALAIYRLSLMTVDAKLLKIAADLGIINAEHTKQLTLSQLISISYKKMGKSLSGGVNALKGMLTNSKNLYMMLGAIAAVSLVKLVRTAQQYKKEVEEINKYYGEIGSKVSNVAVRFKASVDQSDISNARKEFSKLQEIAKKDFDIEYDFKPKDMTLDELEKAFDNIRKDIEKSKDYAREFAIAMQMASTWKFSDNIYEDFEDFSSAAGNAEAVFRNSLVPILDYFNQNEDAVKSLTDTQKQALDELRNSIDKKPNESMLEYIFRLKSALDTLKDSALTKNTYTSPSMFGGSQTIWKNMWNGVDFKPISNASDALAFATNEIEKEYKKFRDSFAADKLIEDEAERLRILKVAIDDLVMTKGLGEFARMYMYMREGIKYTESSDGLDDFDETKYGGDIKTLSDKINLIKNLREEYLKLIKTFDEVESKQKTMDSYRSAFEEAGMNIDYIDFTSEQGVIAALKKLEGLAAKEGLKAKIALQKAIGDVQVGIDVKSTQEQQKDVIDNIEEMFGNYEISLELDKLNIPPNLAKQLFGVDAISLDDIRSEIEAQLTEARADGGKLDHVKDLEDRLKKVKDLEDKQLRERLKTYTEYLTKEQDTRVRMKLEELRKLEEVEELYNQGKYTQEQYATITGNIRREAAAKQAKQTWEDFAKTPYIVQMFDDLDKTSNKSLKLLNDHLQTLKTSLYNAGLPASELKEILDKINQVEKELEARNPFAQIGRGIKDLFTGNIDLTAARKAYDEQIKLQKQADEEVLAARERLDVWSEQNGEDNPTFNTLSAQLEIAKKKANELQKTTDKVTENFHEAQRKVLGMAEGLSTVLGYAQQLGSAFSDMADKLGIMSEEEQAILNSAMNVVGDVANIGMAAAQIAANPANPAAWVQGISSVMSLIGNIAATGDAVREKEIQAEIKKIERLEKAYGKLEKAMEEAYTIDQMKANQASMEQSINAQIAALESAKAKEEANKKTDKDAVDDYTDQIKELEEKKAELEKEMVETMGGTYDYASVAEQFLDAWLSAFEETGDGLSGLNQAFDDFWKDILKKQVVYGGASTILEGFIDEINDRLKDGVLDATDVSIIDRLEEDTKAKLQEFFEYMNSKYNLTDAGESELSGLSKGVQGITETQADILAAYWNAVRFDVSAIRQRFDDFMAMQGMGDEVNPVENHLKTISMNTTAMLRLLEDARGDSEVNAIRVKVLNM